MMANRSYLVSPSLLRRGWIAPHDQYFPTRERAQHGFLRSNAMGVLQKKEERGWASDRRREEESRSCGGGRGDRSCWEGRRRGNNVPYPVTAHGNSNMFDCVSNACCWGRCCQPPTPPRPSPTGMNERPAPCVKKPPKVGFLPCPSARGYLLTSQEGTKSHPLLLFCPRGTRNSGSWFFPLKTFEQ